LPPEPTPAIDLARLQDASQAVREAHDDAATARAGATQRAAELGRATAQPARDDTALREVERLVAACQAAAQTADDTRKRLDEALGLAEQAAGDAPTGDAADLLAKDRALAAEARGWLDEAAAAAGAAARKGRAYLDRETGDAATYAAA